MAKVKTSLDLSNLKSQEQVTRFVSDTLRSIIDEFNGRVSLLDNIESSLIVFNFSGSSEIGVNHSLGFTPNGYFVVGKSANIDVYDGTQENTNITLYLRSTGAGVVKVLVF